MIKDTKLIKFVKTASTYMSSKSVKNIPEDKRFEYFMNMAERIQKLAYVDEAERKEALDKYGSEGSGKNLPFSSLSEDLEKKDKEKKEDE